MAPKAEPLSDQKTGAAKLLTEIALLTVRLEGGLLAAADAISASANLTAARWKVLGAVLEEPKTVAQIARNMGLSRQAVQRLANILVAEGLCVSQRNAAHKSASLVAATPQGRGKIDQIANRQAVWSNEISREFTLFQLGDHRQMLLKLIDRVEDQQSRIVPR